MERRSRHGSPRFCDGLCVRVGNWGYNGAVSVNVNIVLLKLRAYELAKNLDAYTEDDNEHDQLVLESYLNPIMRVKGVRRVPTQELGAKISAWKVKHRGT